MRPLGAEAAELVARLADDPWLDLRSLTDPHEPGPDGRQAWAAWAGERTYGFVVLDPHPDGEIEVTLAVPRADRRRGVGSALLELAMELAAEQDGASLTALVHGDNQAARGFFERHGFTAEPTRLEAHLRFVHELVNWT